MYIYLFLFFLSTPLLYSNL